MQAPYKQASPRTTPSHSRCYHTLPPQRSTARPTRSRPMHHHLHFSLFIALHSRKHRTSRYRFAFAFSRAAFDRIVSIALHCIILGDTARHDTLLLLQLHLFPRCFLPHSPFCRIAFFGDTAHSENPLCLLFFFSRTASCCIGFTSLFGCAFEREWLVRTYNQIDSIE